jgi:hypothetical protein
LNTGHFASLSLPDAYGYHEKDMFVRDRSISICRDFNAALCLENSTPLEGVWFLYGY